LDTPLIAFDTETATLAGAPHLLEVGAVRFLNGDALDHFQALVRPDVPVDPEATAVHGIGDDDVRDADPPADVLAAFAAWAGDAPLLAHNARADAWVLGFEFARRSTEGPNGPLIDTLALARKHLPDAPDHKLETLVEHLELEADERHRALPDAVACWQVVEACLAERGGWPAVALAELLADGGIGQTLRTAGPARPTKRPSIVRALERAIRADAIVRILYGQRDSTPAPLDVRPRMVYRGKDHSYLEGECEQSGLLKTYRLDRVHRVELR